MKEIQEHKIKIYEFPDTEDDEDNKLIRKIKVTDQTVLLVILNVIKVLLIDLSGRQMNSCTQLKVSVSFGQFPAPADASVPFPSGWQELIISLIDTLIEELSLVIVVCVTLWPSNCCLWQSICPMWHIL